MAAPTPSLALTSLVHQCKQSTLSLRDDLPRRLAHVHVDLGTHRRIEPTQLRVFGHQGPQLTRQTHGGHVVPPLHRRREPPKQPALQHPQRLTREGALSFRIGRQLRDESLEDVHNLPAPEIIAREIVEDLTAALTEFEAVAAALEAAANRDAAEN
jgi:hypothetical protein